MRAVFPLVETDSGDPFINEAGVLPSAQVSEVVDPDGKDEVEIRFTSSP
jgi:hypothetical protein